MCYPVEGSSILDSIKTTIKHIKVKEYFYTLLHVSVSLSNKKDTMLMTQLYDIWTERG